MKRTNLVVPLGKDEEGLIHRLDFNEHRHLIMGGATGSGKSVFNHHVIYTLLNQNSPDSIKFILADPKIVELSIYHEGPYFLTNTLTKPEDIFNYLELLNKEISNESYERFIIIDTFSDLMMYDSARFEKLIKELTNKPKLHLIMCDSRVSEHVFSDSILKSFTTRIAFNMPDSEASELLINQEEAKNLKGKGDMLFSATASSEPVHLQAPFISEDEVLKLVASELDINK